MANGDGLTKTDRSAVSRRIQGKVERFADGALVGWVMYTAQPQQPVRFDLMVGDAIVGTFIADRESADLVRKNVGIGRHWFSVSVDTSILKEGANSILITELEEGHAIKGSINYQAEANSEPLLPQSTPSAEPIPAPMADSPAQPVAAQPPPPARAIPAVVKVKLQPDAPEAELDQTTNTPAAQPESDQFELTEGMSNSDLFAAAEKAFKGEEWTKALAIVSAISARSADLVDHRVVLWHGRALIYLNRDAEAVEELRWFDRHQPKRHTAFFYMGVALNKLQKFEEAHSCFMRCLAANPDDTKYLFEAARSTSRMVNGAFGSIEPHPHLLDNAIDLTRRAAQRMTKDARPLRELAHLLLQAGQMEEAVESMQQAIRRSPKLAVLYLEQSRLLTRLDRLEEALEAAKMAASLDPHSDGAGFAVRILQRWLDARRKGPLVVAVVDAPVQHVL